MSTNPQVTSYVSDISDSRLSDAEQAGLADVELTAVHREALAPADNSVRVDVTDLLGGG